MSNANTDKAKKLTASQRRVVASLTRNPDAQYVPYLKGLYANTQHKPDRVAVLAALMAIEVPTV